MVTLVIAAAEAGLSPYAAAHPSWGSHGHSYQVINGAHLAAPLVAPINHWDLPAYGGYGGHHWAGSHGIHNAGHWAGAPLAVPLAHGANLIGHGYGAAPLAVTIAHGAGLIGHGHGADLIGHGHGAGLAVGAGLVGHGHGHAAKYTAITPGAVHEAPLPGHLLSRTSLNVAAPAGTAFVH